MKIETHKEFIKVTDFLISAEIIDYHRMMLVPIEKSVLINCDKTISQENNRIRDLAVHFLPWKGLDQRHIAKWNKAMDKATKLGKQYEYYF